MTKELSNIIDKRYQVKFWGNTSYSLKKFKNKELIKFACDNGKWRKDNYAITDEALS